MSFGKLTCDSEFLLIIPLVNVSITKLKKIKSTPCLLNRQLRDIGSNLTCLLDLQLAREPIPSWKILVEAVKHQAAPGV